MNKDPFIEKHLNRIKIISALYGQKKLFVECYPTDEGAQCFPNSNRAVKEIFIEDIPSSHPEQGEQGSDQEFLQMQFPGKGGSDIHKPSEERELEEIKNTLKLSTRQGEQGELYRWVKASERLPQGLVILRTPDRQGLRSVYEIHVDVIDLETFFAPFKLHEIEWLCKLSSPPPEGQDERIKELEEALRKIEQMPVRFSEGSAIIDMKEIAKQLINKK